MKKQSVYNVRSVSEYHSLYGLRKPTHPLVSVFNYDEFSRGNPPGPTTVSYEFYAVNLKKNFDGKVKYGQQYYDFDDGVMTFYAPKQILSFEVGENIPEGWTLIIHPDFLHGTALAAKVREYGFFGYAVSEALHLSQREQDVIEGIFENLRAELDSSTDFHTQEVVLSHIDLLLSYCSRFYTRQFITRKKVSSDLLGKFEGYLSAYFKENSQVSGLPSVQYFAEKLSVSSHYLNDMLKNLTGSTTQQHIQDHIIERAKELLTTTALSVSEIAYVLGFEHSQSFNKLFKNKVSLTPLAFRQSFN